MNNVIRLSLPLLLLLSSATTWSQQVNITREIHQFSVRHGDRQVVIVRNQDTGAIISNDFALTSRPCPPFCAQPMKVADGVETIGEVELILALRKTKHATKTMHASPQPT